MQNNNQSERSVARRQNNFFLCYFETTRQCNHSCRYCMTKITDSEKKGDELSTEEIKHLVIDEVRKYCSHPAMAFSGGEFLLRSDMSEILEYTARYGLWSFINTNATLLTRERVREIKKNAKVPALFVYDYKGKELLGRRQKEIIGKAQGQIKKPFVAKAFLKRVESLTEKSELVGVQRM